jgi:hypothetical protein
MLRSLGWYFEFRNTVCLFDRFPRHWRLNTVHNTPQETTMQDRPVRTDLHHLHDTAHRHADLLRRQARDDFWRGTDALLASVATRAVRASDRLARRLQRHAAPDRCCPAA